VEGDGNASRDFIYVQDIVNGLVLCATTGKPGDVYNLASGVETSILELAETITQLTESEAGIEFRPGRKWDHSGRRFGSTLKSKQELGFEAQVSLRDGLQMTVQWTRDNMDLIESCIHRHAEQMQRIAQ
jgi:nucleoside-diphosphate-sugar epimerase